MKKLKFKRAYAKNFLPFGPEGIEIKFEDYGNVVLVLGENLDVKPQDSDSEDRLSSNGSGKSSLQEIIVWGLYGKTIKKPKKIKSDGVVHNIHSKKCVVEVEWDDYKVIRGRAPTSLKLFKGKEELTLGESRETQKIIEEKLGLNYEAFVNIVVFADEEENCFLECDGPTKREIVENLLSLGVYRQRFENSKEMQKEYKENIKILSKEYEFLLLSLKESEKRLDNTKLKEINWKKEKEREIEFVKQKIVLEKQKFNNKDFLDKLEKFKNAQVSIKEKEPQVEELASTVEKWKKGIEVFKEQRKVLEDVVRGNKEELSQVKNSINFINSELERINKSITSAKGKNTGVSCDFCYSTVEKENIDKFIEQKNKEKEVKEKEVIPFKENYSEIESKLKENTEKLNVLVKKLTDADAAISSKERTLNSLRTELANLKNIKEPVETTEEAVINQNIKNLEKLIEDKTIELNGISPYEDILINDKNEIKNNEDKCLAKKEEIKKLEEEIPYIDYWLEAFGDNGIRKWVVNDIVPALNSKISYWLQFLIDNKINLKFDNEFEETIERNPPDGNPYIYHAMSKGQRRRLNLALSQSFGHVMTLSTSVNPSIVFLDEVTTNIDPLGVIGIYNMIQELAEEKQVFVTTHDQELLRMLAGCETIKLSHENGVTKIVD